MTIGPAVKGMSIEFPGIVPVVAVVFVHGVEYAWVLVEEVVRYVDFV